MSAKHFFAGFFMVIRGRPDRPAGPVRIPGEPYITNDSGYCLLMMWAKQSVSLETRM